MNEEQFRLHAQIEDQHWWFVARRQILRRLIEQLVPPSPKANLIDVGCGTGGNLGTLADAYNCLGIDTSTEAIHWASQRFPQVRFVQGLAPEDIADAMRTADLVMLNDVLEHVDDDVGLLESLVSAMRPGAHLLLTVPSDRQLWSEHDVSFGHYRRYTMPRLQRVWQDLAVDVRLCSHFNSRLYLPVRAVRTWTRWRGKTMGAAGTDFAIPRAPINRALQGIFAGESRRLSDLLQGRKKRGYGVGVSLIAVLQCRGAGDYSTHITSEVHQRPGHEPPLVATGQDRALQAAEIPGGREVGPCGSRFVPHQEKAPPDTTILRGILGTTVASRYCIRATASIRSSLQHGTKKRGSLFAGARTLDSNGCPNAAQFAVARRPTAVKVLSGEEHCPLERRTTEGHEKIRTRHNSMTKPAKLALEDGTVLTGISFGAEGEVEGEVCFNTSMTGYQEILTDPSYRGQIVTMTYPEIGNYGVNAEDFESGSPHLSGFVVRESSRRHSNFRSDGSLHDFLKQWSVVGIAGVDTRALVRRIRTQGALKGVLSTVDLDDASLVAKAKASAGLVGRDLVKEVVPDQPREWSEQVSRWTHLAEDVDVDRAPASDAPHVVALDYGMKWNIARHLYDIGCKVTVLPGTSTAEEVLSHAPDGVFLSNGPGDPEPVEYAIQTIRDLLGKKPIFGICLGHQLLSLAAGAKTFKLKFGHRGANQPVMNVASQRVEITSQNHGFAVEEEGLPSDLEVTHYNLNDNTIEGVRHKSAPAFSVQYHPEASAGPHDSHYLFQEFRELVDETR